MSLMGTLTKVAIGYVAARGVDKLAGAGGLGALMGGLTGATTQDSETAGNPMQAMMDQVQGMMGGAGFPGGADMQSMLGGLMGGSSEASPQSGGAGLAGMFAAMGGAAALGGQGIGSLVDQFGNAGAKTQESEDTAGLLLRAMIQAAKSDGDIDEAERAKILETVGEDADAEDIAFVQAQLTAPVNVEALAADTPEALRPQVYAMSLMAISVNTEAERAYLQDLAGTLELDDTVVAMLSTQMGS